MCKHEVGYLMSIDDYPALKAHRARMESDAGVRTALHRQDMQPVG